MACQRSVRSVTIPTRTTCLTTTRSFLAPLCSRSAIKNMESINITVIYRGGCWLTKRWVMKNDSLCTYETLAKSIESKRNSGRGLLHRHPTRFYQWQPEPLVYMTGSMEYIRSSRTGLCAKDAHLIEQDLHIEWDLELTVYIAVTYQQMVFSLSSLDEINYQGACWMDVHHLSHHLTL